MTYDSIERSSDMGRPVYLYHFAIASTNWYYTSGDESVSINGQVWEPSAISDDGISQSGEPGSDTLTITAPINVGPAQMFMGTPPAQPIRVAILHMHHNDPQAIVCYSGEVSQIDYAAPGIVQMACITTSATMQRDGLRLGWQRLCPYALYDVRTCKVDKAAFAVPAIVLDVEGIFVFVSTFGEHENPYFAGGFMDWIHPIRGYESRMIEAQSVGSPNLHFKMFGPTENIVPGLAVNLYPGCARTTEACSAFGNLLNYGGCPAMPGKSPFDGTPVF